MKLIFLLQHVPLKWIFSKKKNFIKLMTNYNVPKNFISIFVLCNLMKKAIDFVNYVSYKQHILKYFLHESFDAEMLIDIVFENFRHTHVERFAIPAVVKLCTIIFHFLEKQKNSVFFGLTATIVGWLKTRFYRNLSRLQSHSNHIGS